MKVKELISLLQAMESGSNPDVLIHDCDTGWFLPVHIGLIEDGYSWTTAPENSIVIHGKYDEYIESEK